ncbi:MAG: RNA-binding protein [Gammaproteobacteria bacterium]|nr:RNA-binding protein [Gammaproteobacteria bacterium]
MKKLYVGNLAWGVADDDLQNMFAEFGAVSSAVVITDRETGRSRGFGFVEMDDGAEQAIEALNGQDHQGRPLRVNEAQSKDRGGDRGGNRGGGGGGNRGGGGGGRPF